MPKKKQGLLPLFSSIFSDKKTKEKAKQEAKKSFKFLSFFLLSLIALYTLTSLIPLELTELFVANSVLTGLRAFGLEGEIVSGEPVGIQLGRLSPEITPGLYIEISYLCTGLLEIVFLASVILASAGVNIKKRIIGAVVGAVATMMVNFARIFATAYFIYNSSAQTAEFIHNIFFRVTLFATIFLFYSAWFYWATGQFSEKLKRKNTKK